MKTRMYVNRFLAALSGLGMALTILTAPHFSFANSQCNRPAITSVSPSSGAATVAQDIIITGANFIVNGAANVTSVFAVEVGNPGNVIQATRFVILSPTLIDMSINFGAGNICKTFTILVNGPCGMSEQGAEFKTSCPPPEQLISALKDRVAGLVAAGVLTNKQARPLNRRLDKAVRRVEAGRPQGAIEEINAFNREVDDLMDQGALSQTQGQPLIDMADLIIAQITP